LLGLGRAIIHATNSFLWLDLLVLQWTVSLDRKIVLEDGLVFLSHLGTGFKVSEIMVWHVSR
jgi:hypothetical protein